MPPCKPGISKRRRLWLGAGASVMVGAVSSACTDPAGDPATGPVGTATTAETDDSGPGRKDREALATAPGITAGGESEGEGEGASAADPATDDVEYLHRLGQVRGHLTAFMALHEQGAHDMSMTHAKHPEDELYAELAPAFERRRQPGFAEELSALIDAIENGGEVEEAYSKVQAAIASHEPDADVGTRLKAMGNLVRTAGFEYRTGVEDDGSVSNAHEYQDAWGFLTAARESLARLEGGSAEQSEALAHADEQLQEALGQFDGLTASKTKGNAEAIHGAAARIELAANALH